MSEFKRIDNRIIITAGGKEYPCDAVICGREVARYNRDAKEKLSEIDNSGYSDEAVKNFMEFLSEILTKILGYSALDNIFGEKIGYYDLLDLYNHIVKEYRDFTNYKIECYGKS